MLECRRWRCGFTLIEMLVVIGAIAVLAAIAFPVYSAARGNARQTTCLSNLRQLGTAMRMYAGDWDGCFSPTRVYEAPGKPECNWAGVYDIGGRCAPTLGLIYPYVRNVNVFLCPSARGMDPPRITEQGAVPYPLSYSMNAMLEGRNIDNLRAPIHRVGLMLHEDASTIDDCDFNWMGWAGNPEEGRNQPCSIHNGGTCVIYCDLHAKWQSSDAVIQSLASADWDPDWP